MEKKNYHIGHILLPKKAKGTFCEKNCAHMQTISRVNKRHIRWEKKNYTYADWYPLKQITFFTREEELYIYTIYCQRKHNTLFTRVIVHMQTPKQKTLFITQKKTINIIKISFTRVGRIDLHSVEIVNTGGSDVYHCKNILLLAFITHTCHLG